MILVRVLQGGTTGRSTPNTEHGHGELGLGWLENDHRSNVINASRTSSEVPLRFHLKHALLYDWISVVNHDEDVPQKVGANTGVQVTTGSGYSSLQYSYFYHSSPYVRDQK